MSYYHRNKPKIKGLYSHQKEFVRQMLITKRDGKRISVRPPLKIAEYLEKEKSQSDLIIKLLAEHFAKQRSIYEDYTKEQLKANLDGI